MKTDNTYNGWKNYETWNVALWIGNDEGLYRLAKEAGSYQSFRATMREMGSLGGTETPDGVAYNDARVDTAAINEMIGEL